MPNKESITSSFEKQRTCQAVNKANLQYPSASADLVHEESEKDATESRQGNALEDLAKLWIALGVEIFIDQFRVVRAFVKEFQENLVLRSRQFKSFLLRSLFLKHGGIPKRSDIASLIDLAEAIAVGEGRQRDLYLRSAPVNGTILLDKLSPDGSAYEISPSGVRDIRPEEFPFRREPHMRPLPDVDLSADPSDVFLLWRLMPYLDKTSQVLLAVWVVTVLIPHIPRPCIILHGVQGSGKSIFGEVLRCLVDPTGVKRLGLPRKVTEMEQISFQHLLAVYDNLQILTKEQSDVLCRTLTGLDASKRRLFTDSESVLYSCLHTFILTGISPAATQPDLLDRSLLIELPPISEENRRGEEEIRQKLGDLQPRILGGILKALSGAMAIKDEMRLPRLPRMADWCLWGAAVAEVLGLGKDTFVEAVNANYRDRHWEITDTHPVAKVIMELMKDEAVLGPDSPTNLYKWLKMKAEELQLDRELDWPRAANALSRSLKTLSPSLRAAGLQVIFDRRPESDRSRTVEIRKLPQ